MTGLALLLLTAIGVSIDALIIDRAQAAVYRHSEQVAANWLATVQPGLRIPGPPDDPLVDLVQLVDSHGRVVAASAAARGKPPLSETKPPPGEAIRDVTECDPRGECVMLTALRISPLVSRDLWHGEPHFIYAGAAQRPILSMYRLELLTAAGVLLGAGIAGWLNWRAAKRSLRPVAAIREAMAEITVSDLSLRVPQPPGRSEYAMLACTANRTLARLEEAVKQQRRFASTASHELRTPLTALRARLEEAALYPDDVDPHEVIQDGLSITDRLEAIVDDLLVLARLRAGASTTHTSIDLGALVSEETAARSGGVPVHVRAARDVHVRGNRIQLIRVLDNLLANARRHTATRVEVTVERAGAHAVVTVSDDGDGIAPADRERVFERFVRLDAARRREPAGSGLGLPISRDIAHAHSGTLRVEDSPQGARFVLRLPLTLPDLTLDPVVSPADRPESTAEPRPADRPEPPPGPRPADRPESTPGPRPADRQDSGRGARTP
ncbi:HAMP domain-containing sensor histidine kinase [Microtetraspora sp. NBRC 13810]|uniref:sensor histidine kinase n=1 Tax=Microtetraspora sp. NBRC 13810 TaxID=3030990 RepID=UPI00255364D4|nr:HAMP domain-containing sensor histidine kinase [Microtetraspora sp. NBRC 13810]